MTGREQWLQEVGLRGTGLAPCAAVLSPALWLEYGDKLAEVVKRHPTVCGDAQQTIFGHEELPVAHKKGELYTDAWGCVWNCVYDGLEGQIVKSPLEDWSALDSYRPPDALTQAERGPREDWDEVARRLDEIREAGGVTSGFTDRFYERVHFVRGYMNFMMDVAEGRPELDRLIEMVLEYDMELVEKWIKLGVDVIGFADDLGMQDRLQISPDAWRRYFKPGYDMMFQAARKAGIHTSMHSDGYLIDIVPDLIENGLSLFNLQDLCNGLDNIKRVLKGKAYIQLDVDRQKIVPFGTPDEIDAHILNCVKTLGSPKGGLTLAWWGSPGTPLENIEALFAAMERHRAYWTEHA